MPKQPALQFRLRSILVITVAIAMLFGLLRWLGVPPQASVIVMVVLGVSLAAAVGLVVVIARGMGWWAGVS